MSRNVSTKAFSSYLVCIQAIAIEFLPEVQMTQFITCKHYDEMITKILKVKSYNDAISTNQESNQQQEQQYIHKNKKIKRTLVVDDEYDISLTIKVFLEQSGFKVDSFTDADEALENFTTGRYDLVILDVKMPGMSGFRLYREIRKLHDKVSVCFLTAADDL
ncbi:MAG: response regulator [Candidatus Nitrosopolaris sp.]